MLKNNPKYLYLDLICGKGTGELLFRHIENIAEHLGQKQIRLSAVPNAMLQYYKRYGFKFGNSCNMNTNLKMQVDTILNTIVKLMLEITELRQTFQKATLASQKKKIQGQIKKKENKRKTLLSKVETILGKRNLGAEKDCYKKGTCNIEGYKMTKCL